MPLRLVGVGAVAALMSVGGCELPPSCKKGDVLRHPHVDRGEGAVPPSCQQGLRAAPHLPYTCQTLNPKPYTIPTTALLLPRSAWRMR